MRPLMVERLAMLPAGGRGADRDIEFDIDDGPVRPFLVDEDP